jgi:hypothetical protein
MSRTAVKGFEKKSYFSLKNPDKQNIFRLIAFCVKTVSLCIHRRQIEHGIEGDIWIKVTGGWRKLHIEVLHNLCSLPGINRMVSSREISWAGGVAHMGERYIYMITLKWVLNK